MKKGLTLIELLVVISILTTLAALLFPVYSGLRKRLYAIQCANQLRQIGLAFKMYANDHGRDDPYVVTDLDKLYPHYIPTEQLLVCPYFQSLAPEVVAEMHEGMKKYRGVPWYSYFVLIPKGLDAIARKYPDKSVSFAEVYAVLGDRVPIAFCDVHRIGCPISLTGVGPKSRQFISQNCTIPYVIIPPEFKEFEGLMPFPPGALSDLSQPWIILRWDGSVYFDYSGGWERGLEDDFLKAIKDRQKP